MRKSSCAAVLLLLMVLPLAAQTAPAPDFTGTWVLNLAKSVPGKDSTVKEETIVIANKKSTVVFSYKTDGKKSTEKYTPDGQPRVMQDLSSGELISKARWQGSSLIIESTLQIKIPNVTVNVTGLKPVVDTWTLASDGQTLSHESEDPKEVFVYEKK